MSPVLSRILVLFACAALVACSAKDQQQAQQTVQSAALSAAVDAKLASVDADAPAQVKIDNNGGVVTLSGQAHSAHERSAYASAAASVQGVKRVVNNIRVDTPAAWSPRVAGRCCARGQGERGHRGASRGKRGEHQTERA